MNATAVFELELCYQYALDTCQVYTTTVEIYPVVPKYTLCVLMLYSFVKY